MSHTSHKPYAFQSFTLNSWSLRDMLWNLFKKQSFQSSLNLLVRSFSKASWIRLALRLWSIVCLWSEKVFLSAENDLSHVAADAPKVAAILKAAATPGIAPRLPQNSFKIFSAVQFSCWHKLDGTVSCFSKNDRATANSSLTTGIPHKCISGAIFAGMRNTSLFSGFKADSEHITSLFQSEKRAFISFSTTSITL